MRIEAAAEMWIFDRRICLIAMGVLDEMEDQAAEWRFTSMGGAIALEMAARDYSVASISLCSSCRPLGY